MVRLLTHVLRRQLELHGVHGVVVPDRECDGVTIVSPASRRALRAVVIDAEDDLLGLYRRVELRVRGVVGGVRVTVA